MKIGLVSDLHLEFYKPSAANYLLNMINNTDVDIRIVAGDVSPNNKFRKEFLSKIDNCISVEGNHDFYQNSSGNLNPLNSNIQNITLTNGMYIVACTLWTDYNNDHMVMSNSHRIMNDNTQIPNFDPQYIYQVHNTQKNYIFETNPNIVITHHCCSPQSISPQFRHERFELSNYYFHSNLDEKILNSNIKLWVYGHTHWKHSYKIGNTLVVCNPLGYPNEIYNNYKDYKMEIIEI